MKAGETQPGHTNEVEPTCWKKLCDRFLEAFPINMVESGWNRQVRYDAKFYYPKHDMSLQDLQPMLDHEHWLGARALPSGIIYWISIDIDAKSAELHPDRDRRYWALRKLFGLDRVPLVYRTPSGYGLRLLYRIPPTPIDHLVEDQTTGLVADVIRGAGLEVKLGIIEIFPQRRFADRLPLGRNMPLLDPQTLDPYLFERATTDRITHLDMQLRVLEEWARKPDPTWLPHVQSLPRISEERGNGTGEASEDAILLRTGSGGGCTDGTMHLIHAGLTEPSTRVESEWRVGLGFLAAPSLSTGYPLPEHPTRADLARALATWLSVHHNEKSKDWAKAQRKYGTDGAVEFFARAYLKEGRSGSLIDRLHRAYLSANPGALPVRQLSPGEWDTLLDLASEFYEPSVHRYRFEVWSGCFHRACREQIHRLEARGQTPPSRTLRNRDQVSVELPAAWMVGWPYGSGRDRSAKGTRYLEYLRVLETAGMIAPGEGYYNPRFRLPSDIETEPGRAAAWWVDRPKPVYNCELPMLLHEVKGRTKEIPEVHNRPVSITEAYHALHVHQRSIDLEGRYGRRTADRLNSYLRVLFARLDG